MCHITECYSWGMGFYTGIKFHHGVHARFIRLPRWQATKHIDYVWSSLTNVGGPQQAGETSRCGQLRELHTVLNSNLRDSAREYADP